MAMTHLSYPECALHELMQRTAAKYPDRTAIAFRGRRITFQDFDQESSRLARGLRELGD